MQGLRHILVWLTGHQYDATVLTHSEERWLLEPLLAVQEVPDFHVILVSQKLDLEGSMKLRFK